MNHFEDDIEEQIEASTILLDNGQSKPQKITIKFRKERSGVTATTSFSNTVPSPIASPSATKTPKQKKKKKKGSAGKTAIKTDEDADEDDSHLLPTMLTSSNDSYSNTTPRKNGLKKTATTWSTVEIVGSADSRSSVARPSDSSEAKSSARNKFEFGRDDTPNQTWATEFDDSDDENDSINGTATCSSSARFSFTGVASTPIRNNNNGM